MTTVANRPTLIGDLVKAEFWKEHNYTRAMETLTVAAYSEVAPHGVEIGQVYKDGALVAAADVATLTGPLSILVDDKAYTDGHADAASVSYAVINDGPVIVTREQLKFADTLSAGQVDTVVGLLEAQGIKVRNQY